MGIGVMWGVCPYCRSKGKCKQWCYYVQIQNGKIPMTTPEPTQAAKKAAEEIFQHKQWSRPGDIAAIIDNHMQAEREELERLRKALQKVVDAEEESCPECEGNGDVYADGKAHYPTDGAETVACGSCGGSGYIAIDIELLKVNARQALAQSPQREYKTEPPEGYRVRLYNAQFVADLRDQEGNHRGYIYEDGTVATDLGAGLYRTYPAAVDACWRHKSRQEEGCQQIINLHDEEGNLRGYIYHDGVGGKVERSEAAIRATAYREVEQELREHAARYRGVGDMGRADALEFRANDYKRRASNLAQSPQGEGDAGGKGQRTVV